MSSHGKEIGYNLLNFGRSPNIYAITDSFEYGLVIMLGAKVYTEKIERILPLTENKFCQNDYFQCHSRRPVQDNISYI